MFNNNELVFLLGGLILLWGTGAGAEQHKIADYQTARALFWAELYPEGGKTLYCNARFGRHRGRGLNVEHVFPMSWAGYSLKCGKRWQCRKKSERFNRIEADLHNLYPARADINEARSSYRFGEIEGEKRQFGSCDFEIDERRRVAEPRPAVRGDIARSMLYMQGEYGLYLKPRLGRLFLRWHFQDPPTSDEKRRNDLIERLQGTRNPYVDNPALAHELNF